MEASPSETDPIREQALESLKRKRAFRSQVATWVGVSARESERLRR